MLGPIPPLLQYAFMAWCSVKKPRDNFTITFIELMGFILVAMKYCVTLYNNFRLRLFIYVDGVNLLGQSINTMQKNTETQ
jgi:hypothetical protein